MNKLVCKINSKGLTKDKVYDVYKAFYYSEITLEYLEIKPPFEFKKSFESVFVNDKLIYSVCIKNDFNKVQKYAIQLFRYDKSVERQEKIKKLLDG